MITPPLFVDPEYDEYGIIKIDLGELGPNQKEYKLIGHKGAETWSTPLQLVPKNASLPQILNLIFGTAEEQEQDSKIRAELKRKAEMN